MGIIVEIFTVLFVCVYVLKCLQRVALNFNYTTILFVLIAVGGSIYEGATRNSMPHTLLLFYALQSILILGATIDMQYYILPNEGAISICVLSLLHMRVSNVHISHYICQCFCLLVLFFLVLYYQKNSVGLGDVKWLLALSLWYDTLEFIGVLTISFTCGALWGIYKKWVQRESTIIPFGPCIVMGSLWGHHYESLLENFF